ncbi:hypothetical protein [Nitrosophilus alvini]|uniref:hypothetical protein n=1 Tax=Nitrosophilus alvini TaxID=2714855 RepID=UPI00190DDD37|nr:hypothetical protein [Nitrosophilus alvini]
MKTIETKGEMKREELFNKAVEYFMNGDYQNSLFCYSLILKEYPEDKEARIGALLCDMAMESATEAHALFDYYTVLKEEDEEGNAEEIIEDLIDSFNTDSEKINRLLKNTQNFDVDMEDGINYNDFKMLIEDRGSFRRAFEDIMFSTRVIIEEKKDFIDFLEQLIKNGFDEMALSYLEDAYTIYPADEKLQELFEKIKPMTNHEN